MPIHVPRVGQVWTLDQVSKRQLAQKVNEQSQEIQALQKSRKELVNIMLAIVAEPDAVQCVEGSWSVDAEAVARVTDGDQLHARPSPDGRRVVLSRTPKGSVSVDVGTTWIVVPQHGTH